jgi:hypothetical protein
MAINPTQTDTTKNGIRIKRFFNETAFNKSPKKGFPLSFSDNQKFIRSNTTGNTTAVAFERQDNINRIKEKISHKYFPFPLSLNFINEIKPDKKKKLYKISFLPDTQATDSTCIGCTANTAATRKDKVMFFLNRMKTR